MEEIVSNLIEKHLGFTALIGLLAVGAFIYLIWWTRGMYDKTKKIEDLPCSSHSQKLETLISLSTKLDGLPCSDHKIQLENQMSKYISSETTMQKVLTSITFMQKSIDSLSQNLQKTPGIITDRFTQRQSPLTITQEGKKMIIKLGIFDMIDRNWERILLLIEKNAQSRNPYDIQQFCIEQAVVFPEKFLQEDEINKIKLEAYQEGEVLTSYMKAIAVLVRDRYFKEHNIDIADVDKHAPQS